MNELMKVKAIMKDKISTDSGIIYDLIAQYSFIKQLNYANPLSEIKKKNIKTYFKTDHLLMLYSSKTKSIETVWQ